MRHGFLLVILLAGCATDDTSGGFSAVHAQAMGPNQWMISCVDSPGYCANSANRHCPRGFDVTSNVVNPADFGRMTMIVKCTTPAVSADTKKE